MNSIKMQEESFFSVIFTVMMMIPCGMNKANADACCFPVIYTESYQYRRIASASHWEKKKILSVAKSKPDFFFILQLVIASDQLEAALSFS